MTSLNIISPESFLEPETRCDFEVTARRKRLWQMQMELLQIVNHICEKHNLTFFANGGTLLGAIRHQGYIPWDDDIDLAMPRRDYNKFIKVAESELEYPFFLQTPFTENDYAFPHVKIRNSNSVCATKYDFGFSYNKGVFIDIFPIDNMPDDTNNRKSFINTIAHYNRLFNVGVRKFWYIDNEVISDEEKAFCSQLIKHRTIQAVYREFDDFCSIYNNRRTKEGGFVALEVTSERYIWHNEDLKDIIWVPFEYLTIPIPKNFDNVLKQSYGDYNIPVRGGQLHGQLIFEPDIPYQQFDISNSIIHPF